MKAIGYALMFVGSIFMLIGVIGMWVRKNYMEKLHYLTISDTIGMLLFLLGTTLFLHDIFKGAFMIILYAILAPTTSHVLARTFYLGGK